MSSIATIPDRSELVEKRAGAMGSRAVWIILAVGILLLALVSRLGLLAYPFLNDSGLYVYMGKTVATGGTLYRDFYETKLPGVGLIAAVFWNCCGTHWAGYVLGQFFLTVLAAAFLARAAWRHIDRAAALPAFLFAVVFLNFDWAVYTGFQLETIQTFFEALSAMFILESLGGDDWKNSLIAGIAAGFAGMIKPSGVGIGFAFAMALLVQRRRFYAVARHVTAFACGVAIPTLLTLLYAARSGAWAYLPRVIQQIERYANATPISPIWPAELLIVVGLLCFPVAVRLVNRRVPNSGYGRKMNAAVLIFIVSWFLIDSSGIILQRRLYLYHFLPLAAPMALAYAAFPRRIRPVQVVIGLLPIALLSLRWEGCDLWHISRGFHRQELSEYVSAHTAPQDSVFMDQIGQLLIETGRHPGSRFGTFFYFVNYDSAPQEYSKAMLSDFEQRKPKYILLKSSRAASVPGMASGPILSLCPQRRENFVRAWKDVEGYVTSHYQLETVMNGTDVYRRRRAVDSVAGVKEIEN